MGVSPTDLTISITRLQHTCDMTNRILQAMKRIDLYIWLKKLDDLSDKELSVSVFDLPNKLMCEILDCYHYGYTPEEAFAAIVAPSVNAH